MDDINVYGETGIFIIKEQIFSKNGLPSIGHFSPSAVQIQRYVYQLRKEQEVFWEGRKIDYTQLGIWEKFKILMGNDLVSRDKQGGSTLYSLEFAGFETRVTPLDGAKAPLPDFLGKSYKINVPTPYIYGQDPIPEMKLYGRKDVSFIMSNGGLSAPTAMAKYNKTTKNLIMIRTELEMKNLMLSLSSAKELKK